MLVKELIQLLQHPDIDQNAKITIDDNFRYRSPTTHYQFRVDNIFTVIDADGSIQTEKIVLLSEYPVPLVC